MINKLLKEIWISNQDVNISDTFDDEEKEFLYCLAQFQKGDFSLKKEFINKFLYGDNWQLFVLSIRVFMAICNHEDFELLIDFLGECDEKQLHVFLTYVEESLSMQVIPYLLALYEEWEETYIGDDIACCICEMLGREYLEEVHYDIDELSGYFSEFVNQNDLSLYYYRGKPYFLGSATKKLISVVMFCKNKSSEFYDDELVSIISNGVGKACPICNASGVSDEKVQQLFEYVKEVAQMQQVTGKKYFYNIPII